MNLLRSFIAFLCSICFIFILLITSVEAVTYWTPGYFEKEYNKYQVADSVSMEMGDLLYVTDEMMKYLKGIRSDLHISTKINNIEREFFNEKEIAHMEDVKVLFLAAITIRRLSIGFIILCILFSLFSKVPVKVILAKSFCFCCLIFLVITAILGLIISTDFTKYFTIFHLIFFDNDLWLLDPRTDLLINIVPEPFFVDTALRIGMTFFMSIAVSFIISILIIIRQNSVKRIK